MKSRIIAYLMLSIALSATVFCYTLLQAMAGTHIAGASTQRRYFTLGVEMSRGVKYTLSGQLAERLQHRLPSSFAIATEFIVPPAYNSLVLPNGSRHLPVAVAHVSAHYFRAVDLPRVTGRVISAADIDAGASVVVLDRRCAMELFGSADAALGRALVLETKGSRFTQTLHVIGIVPNAFRGIRVADSYLYRNQPMAWVPNLPMFFQPALLSVPANIPYAAIRQNLDLAWKSVPQLIRGTGSRDVIPSWPAALDPQGVDVAIHRLRLYQDLALAALGLTAVNLVAIDLLDGLRNRSVRAIERALGASHAWQRRRGLYRASLGGAWMLATSILLLIAAFSITKRAIAMSHHQYSPWLRVGNVLGWSHWFSIVLVAIASAMLLDMMTQWLAIFKDHHLFHSELFGSPPATRRAGAAILLIEFGMVISFATLAGWGLQYALQAAHQNMGMLQGRRLAVLTIGIKQKFYASSPNGVLIADLRHAISTIDPGSRAAFGPVIGFPYHHGAGNFRDLGPGSLKAGGSSGLDAQSFAATTNWLRVAEINLLAGRGFSPGHANPNDVLIDASIAQTLFGSVQAAVGRQVRWHPVVPIGPASFFVRGVFAPLRLNGPMRAPVATMISPLQPDGQFFMDGSVGGILIRPAIPAARYPALQSAVQRVFAKDAPSLKVTSIQSSAQLLNRLDRPQRTLAMVFGAVAGFGLLIALTGLLVFLRLYLTLRKRVDAIRSALGSSPRRQYAGVLLGTLALGMAGALLALLFTPWLAQQFALLSGAQVAPFGWPTWIALAVLLLAVFLVAHFPARRAARAEPAESLHEL